MSEDEKTDAYARVMLTEAREELVRADGKAGLLLAASGVGLGALLGGLLSRNWTPFSLDNRVEWLWWLGVAAAAYALSRLGRAVWPRTVRKGSPPDVVAYYGDVNRYEKKPLEELRAVLRTSAQDPTSRHVDQLRQVSLIVRAKYAGVRAALVALPAAALLCGAAVVMSDVLK